MSFSKEPTVWLGLIRAALYLGAHFGLKLSAEQTAAIVLFVEAVTVVVNRQSVSPIGSGK